MPTHTQFCLVFYVQLLLFLFLFGLVNLRKAFTRMHGAGCLPLLKPYIPMVRGTFSPCISHFLLTHNLLVLGLKTWSITTVITPYRGCSHVLQTANQVELFDLLTMHCLGAIVLHKNECSGWG